MELAQIVLSIRRNKVGAVLIGLQIGFTLAILSNSLSIIQQRVEQMRRPSGLDERNTFTLKNTWVGKPDDLASRIQEDVRALRSLPSVVDATVLNSYPLRGGGWHYEMSQTRDQRTGLSREAAVYFSDEHGLAALGVKLVAGRWFNSDEISEFRANDVKSPSNIVLTQPLARALFPGGNALGQVVYVIGSEPSRVVGIVERLQTPFPGNAWGEDFVELSAIAPFAFVDNGIFYLVRTRPGRQADVMRMVEEKLFSVTQARIIEQLRPFSETRSRAYGAQRATSLVLTVVSILLLITTACGVVGLTTYWVGQRRRQIGIRRALGARAIDILRYFHLENLFIAGTGAVFGIVLCVIGNLVLASNLAMTTLSIGKMFIAAAIVIALSQLAVVWPSLRAAAISPAIAARGLERS